MRRTETLQILELCRALIRFTGSIRVREIRVNEIRVNEIRVRDFRVKMLHITEL